MPRARMRETVSTISSVANAMCCTPGPAEVVEILRDLGPPATGRRLVDRELDAARAVLHHLRHEGRVLGGDRLVVEVQELGEPHRLREELHPSVHLAQLDVGHDVVDGGQSDVAGRWLGTEAHLEPRREHPGVALPFHEPDQGLAVGADGRGPDETVLVAILDRLRRADGAVPLRFREGVSGVGHLQRDHRHAVAVRVGEAGRRVVGGEAAREDETNRPAFQDVRRRLAAAGLEGPGRPVMRKPNACW